MMMDKEKMTRGGVLLIKEGIRLKRVAEEMPMPGDMMTMEVDETMTAGDDDAEQGQVPDEGG